MVETRSMMLVVLIVLNHVESVVDVCEETHFASQHVSLTSFIIFPFQGKWSLSLIKSAIVFRSVC